jgi:hypothetical protein
MLTVSPNNRNASYAMTLSATNKYGTSTADASVSINETTI